ncbi:MAG: class I SAM-dependent methyltransferase [Verrucomicrobia bacterium]|nr:class I SAM-dependent methyltransferase [Verrucomicrobiota bacterium]MCH8528279.1 class I SAM-dependent methyltransferase [Kiritimatiellia bacterium]
MKRVEVHHDTAFVRDLFEEMSSTYGVMNSVTSFGFSERWRCEAVKRLSLREGGRVCDLMCGMGESWKYLRHHHPQFSRLTGVDFSPCMCAGAQKKAMKFKGAKVEVLTADVLTTLPPDAPFDAVVCTFGLKTLDEKGLKALAVMLKRLLKARGAFSFVEISIPAAPALRAPYLFYLNRIIPILGRLFLGNPDNYRMLGAYTREFQNCRMFQHILQEEGFQVEYRDLFFGCASLLHGTSLG